jgi:hypothetical protein
MSTDGGLWQEFKSHLKWWDWQRIESGLTGSGIPDLNGCCMGHDIWVELKWTDGWKPGIRSEQVGWAERRARAGGKVFLAVRRRCEAGVRRAAADELWVYGSDGARLVLDGGLKGKAPRLMFTGGPSKWDWSALNELFLS